MRRHVELVGARARVPPVRSARRARPGRTDLPVPRAATRLRIDLYDERGRWFDSRDIARPTPSDWPATFGVYSDDVSRGTTVFVRLRAYPEGHVRDYRGERFVDWGSSLVPPEGTRTPRLVVDGREVTPASEPEPLTTVDRAVAVRLEPSRRGAVRVLLAGACAGTMLRLGPAPGSEEAIDTQGLASWPATFGVWVDAHEVSVARFREALARGFRPPKVPLAEERPLGSTATDTCSWSAKPQGREDLAVTCIPWSTARAYCKFQEGDLLTEAQWEYLATTVCSWGRRLDGRPRHRDARRDRIRRPYVWGDDDPKCKDTVYGRDPRGSVRTMACLANGSGPARAGTAERDRIALEGGEVVDLNGNVDEWVLDAFQAETGSCWGSGLFRDPMCQAGGSQQSVRGGSWALFDILTRAQLRTHLPRDVRPAGDTGFRCARNGNHR